MDRQRQIDAVIEGMRSAFRDGDTNLGPSDQRMLHAIVFDSAQQTSSWVASRLPGGSALREPVKEMAADLEPGNTIGRTFDLAWRASTAAALKAAISAVVTQTWPFYLLAIAAFIGGVMTRSYEGGFALGAGTAVILAGLTGGMLATLGRTTARVGPAIGQSLSRGAQAFGEAVTATFAEAPARTFDNHVSGPLRELGAPHLASQVPVLRKVRFVFNALRVIGLALLLAGTFYFATGFLEGFVDETNRRQSPTFPTVPQLGD